MRSPWTTVVIAILSLFVLVVAIGQMFFAQRADYSSEVAFLYDHEADVTFEGVYMRDETLIYNSGTGVLNFEYEDGTKVGKSSVIARRYKSENDSVYLREIENLKKQIEVLDSAEKLIGTDSSQLEAISAQINESHSDIISAVLDGDYSMASAKQSSLLEAMCKREITLNEITVQNSDGYSAKKAELNREISRLESLISGSIQEVTAGNAGYFVSNVDGYEGEIGYADISEMTAEKIAEIVDNPKKSSDSTAIGKLISDYHWRVAAVIDEELVREIGEGDTVTLRVGSDGQKFEVDVVSKTQADESSVVCVFECDRLNSSVAMERTARFKLIIDSYSGLRVPRKALHYNDAGERGVFIEQGKSLVFKKVEVIYWDDDYIICEKEVYEERENEDDEAVIDEDYLKLYDIIVTKGKDLYDGKFIG